LSGKGIQVTLWGAFPDYVAQVAKSRENVKFLPGVRVPAAVRLTADLKEALDLHRKAQWRLDFVSAENSMGFHAPQEAARILAEAIDYARQGQLAAEKAPGRRGER
jgi:formate-dependent nitrite reductase cytochrome c552 subunit